MQTFLFTKYFIFISFIQMAFSLPVQAEVFNKNLEATKKSTFEVNYTPETPTVDKTINPIVIPKIKKIQHTTNLDSSINTDITAPQKRTSSSSLFMPHITKTENKYIPVMADATIFSNFDEELPAIVNYYTYATEKEIITFYQSTFDKALKQEHKRGRLTLSYNKNDKPITVIISQQDNKYQVDVMMTSP